jgi:bis(5'-nucleosyl)-tetraphosphatase (symmetrical)
MSLYCIGDVQGCNAALGRLLDEIAFSPSRDTMYVLGDLVNRGPDSLGVLRRLIGHGASARCLLGNHDLHLLAVAHGARRQRRGDTFDDILDAPDCTALLDWVRHQNLAMFERDVLMVHAGVLPGWTCAQALALAGEVEAVLRGPDIAHFLLHMYGDEPAAWDDTLTGTSRLRVIVNALTRLRFCTTDGVMEFATKEGASGAPQGYRPWFDVPGRRTTEVTVAFGHWSTLGWLGRSDVIALDSGCVWGGHLSAIRLDDAGTHELIQVQCPQAQKPGPGQ